MDSEQLVIKIKQITIFLNIKFLKKLGLMEKFIGIMFQRNRRTSLIRTLKSCRAGLLRISIFQGKRYLLILSRLG